MPIDFAPYRKAITALVGAAIAWATVVTQSPVVEVTAAEWIEGGILLATALGVYGVRNAIA
jgi:hypothetical protein